MDEYWWCTYQALQFEDGKGPTSIVDDGGDMTMMLLEGIKWGKIYEKEKKLPDINSYKTADEKTLMKLISEEIQKDANVFIRLSEDLIGLSEETTTGVLRLN